MSIACGRFAPSPTGPLHFGSLVTALASFLDIRQQQGIWLVRIEDLDPLRESPEAADRILHSLDAHHLNWDGSVRYQSKRLDVYRGEAERLIQQRQAYYCPCSRKELQGSHGRHPNRCREKGHEAPDHPHAVRFALEDEHGQWEDLILGLRHGQVRAELDDPVILRKEGFVAYQLAVVVDDLDQGVNQVVRGSDLIDNTLQQRQICQALGGQPPAWGHIPVVLNEQGQKLSKQNHAPALDDRQPGENIWQALRVLAQQPPAELRGARPQELLAWACANWQRRAVTSVGEARTGPEPDTGHRSVL